jgi:hypothetical protein
MLAMASINTRIGAKLRPATDTEADASVVTVVFATSPWALAVPLAACVVVAPGPAAAGDAHDAPPQTAPEAAEPEPPAATDTLCVWLIVIAPWPVGPPGTSWLVCMLLLTFVWAVNPVAATGLLLGDALPGGSAAAGASVVTFATADPDWAWATPVSWMLTVAADWTLMGA